MTPTRWLFLFLGVLTALRLAYIGQMELSPDESYYLMWSQRLDLSYYSKGPGVALAIKAGTSLFGPTEFGVRFLSPLLALGTSLLMFSFGRRLYGESVAIWAVVGINLIPIFNVGSLVMTIDPLSIFFWTAALYTFWLALQRSPGFSGWWPATGLLIGAGFLCKYTNAMELLSIVLVLIASAKYRGEFRRPGFYAMLACFALALIPPVVWNARHEWITLAHLSARGGLDSAFSLHPEELLAYLGAHMGVYSPIIFVLMMIALWQAWRSVHFTPRFLAWFATPLLALYFFLSLKQAGEANWTAPAFVSLGLLTASYWHERRSRLAVWGLALALFMSLIVVNTEVLRVVGIPLPYKFDPGARLRGWKSTAERVEQTRKEFEKQLGQPVFLIGNKYQTAAILAFYMAEKRAEFPGHPPVYIPESQGIENQFSFWSRYDEFIEPSKVPQAQRDEYYTEEAGVNPFMGRTALYITDRAEERPPTSIKNGFERTEMIALYDLERRGQRLRQIRIFACYNYRTQPL